MINNTFPIPEPDRRTINKEHSLHSKANEYNQNPFRYISPGNDVPSNKLILSEEKEGFNWSNTMTLATWKHNEDMRRNILNFNLFSDKDMFLSNSSNITINKCNVILFGPSGSGKSSFIKSWYRAWYNTFILPPEAMNKLKIKNTNENEGTLCFTRLHLIEESRTSSGITLWDTRGHIKMNESEKEQFKVIIDGVVKDDIIIEQKSERNPWALWEFWKKDTELFPKNIYNTDTPGLDSIPHAIVFVFDGSSDEVIASEDEIFYRNWVEVSKNKGYNSVHVILTRIDLFEKITNEKNKFWPSTDRSTKMNTIKDEKIERVIEILGWSRANVHFIENYHQEDARENNIEIDYHWLKTLSDIINACELFMLRYLNQNESCFASCFRGGK